MAVKDNYELAKLLKSLETTGDGTKVLTNDGTYKPFSGAGASGVEYNNNGVTNVNEALDEIFNILYVAPSITSFNHNQGYVERGIAVTKVILNWNINKDIITQSLTDAGSLAVGLRTYTFDPVNISTNKTYTLTVGDGKNNATSNTTINFISPFFYGVGPKAMTSEQIKSTLTKDIKPKSNSTVKSTNIIDMAFYCCYPKEYGKLTSINEQSTGFDYMSDFVIRTESFVGLDGISRDYYVYEYNTTLYSVDGFTMLYKF